MTYDPLRDVIYATDGASQYTIHVDDDAISEVGVIEIPTVRALACDTIHDALYGATRPQFLRIHVATGAGTLIGTTNALHQRPCIRFGDGHAHRGGQ